VPLVRFRLSVAPEGTHHLLLEPMPRYGQRAQELASPMAVVSEMRALVLLPPKPRLLPRTLSTSQYLHAHKRRAHSDLPIM
jgi:hypothetical protein